MPVFYFNVITGGKAIADLEGTDLPNLEAARSDAIADARELMSAAVLDGRDISQRQIEICGESGDILLVVRFTDAIKPAE
jgi:hypothetical protein